MADLETLMYGSMVHSVQEVENLRRQRDYYNRIQNQGAFDQYGGYPQYGGGYGGGRGNYNSAVQKLMLEHQLRTTREQQKYDLWQQQEEYTAQSKTQEMQRKLDELAKQRDQVANNKLLGETQRQEYLQRIDDEAWEIKTGLGVDVPRIYQRPSGYTTRDKDGNEMSVPMFYYYKQDGSIDIIDNGSAAWTQEKGRKEYEDAQRKTDIAEQTEKRMKRETTVKERIQDSKEKTETPEGSRKQIMKDHGKEAYEHLEEARNEKAEENAERTYTQSPDIQDRYGVNIPWDELTPLQKRGKERAELDILRRDEPITREQQEEEATRRYKRTVPYGEDEGGDRAQMFGQPPSMEPMQQPIEEQFAQQQPEPFDYDPLDDSYSLGALV